MGNTASVSLNQFGHAVSFVSKSEVRSHILEDVLRGPRTPSELASMENKHVSHVSRALRELQALGLVESVQGDPGERYSGDKKKRRYGATDLGYLMAATFTKTAR